MDDAVTDCPQPSFGALLRRHRFAAGLSQEALAERSGLGARTIQDLERGIARPRRETVRRLVGALATSPEAVAQLASAAPGPRRRSGSGDRQRRRSVPERQARTEADALPGAFKPAHLTSFIGRERELVELRELLGACRLLTLTGAGGCGKTRLAMELVPSVADLFPNGSVVVALAPLSDPGLVLSAIAGSLDLQEAADRPLLQTIQRWIGERHLLLVLDNFEHLLPAGPPLLELLTACPHLAILVTSREVLRLSGEQIYPLRPLAVPNLGSSSGDGESSSSLADAEAVRLFLDRARSARPGFRPDGRELRAVAEICVRLDGLPLAIELAAAHARLLSPEAIRIRLRQRLPLLTCGPRDLPERQRTLRDAIDWSYGLLDKAEQRLFRRLGVFAGGWTFDLAEAVCGADGELGVNLLEGLRSLADKSLVVARGATAGEPRFGMLETIREFALEQLAAGGELESLRRRHAEALLDLAEAADQALRTAEQGDWLARLELEHDNLRAALAWSHARPEGAEVALRLAGSLAWFWYLHGHFGEGRPWLDRIVARSEGLPGAARGKALAGAGLLALRQADYDRAHELLEDGLGHYDRVGDTWGRGWCHSLQAMVARERGNYAAAAALFEASAEAFRAVDDPWGLGWAVGSHGLMATRLGDFDRAARLLEESQTTHSRLGNTLFFTRGLMMQGLVEEGRGNLARATSLLEESLGPLRELGDSWAVGQALDGLGRVSLGQGDALRAEALHREALALYWDIGHRIGVTSCLDDLARVWIRRGDARRGACLIGAAEALRATVRAGLAPPRQRLRTRALAEARAALPDEALEAALEQGRAMSLEQAVAYALAARSPVRDTEA
jgi:predicted ATPase